MGREGLRGSAKRVVRLADDMKADSPKGYQAVKDAASSGKAMKAANAAKAQAAAEGYVGRNVTFGRIGTVAESAGRKVTSIARGVARGLLSPAGLAEGVAGSIAKIDSGKGKAALSRAMHANDKVKMPPPPKAGKKRA
jgi:hypothetical protein